MDKKFYEKNWKKFHDKKENVEEIHKLIEQSGIIYLNNSSIDLYGIKFYGSPYIPLGKIQWGFCLNSKEKLEKNWNLIPKDTDVLITHGPPMGYLDFLREV